MLNNAPSNTYMQQAALIVQNDEVKKYCPFYFNAFSRINTAGNNDEFSQIERFRELGILECKTTQLSLEFINMYSIFACLKIHLTASVVTIYQ